MHICKNCKHCMEHERYRHMSTCEKHPIRVNFVSGEATYHWCGDINTDGNCHDYESTLAFRIKKRIEKAFDL